MLGPFHWKRANKLYRKYKPVRITQEKEHLLIWNSEATQNLKSYLHNYQTETAICLATKHEKTIMASNYLNFSIQKIHQSSRKWWLLWGIAYWKWLWSCFNQFLLLWIYYSANPSEAVQKRRLAQGYCWSYANSLNSANFMATPMKEHI